MDALLGPRAFMTDPHWVAAQAASDHRGDREQSVFASRVETLVAAQAALAEDLREFKDHATGVLTSLQSQVSARLASCHRTSGGSPHMPYLPRGSAVVSCRNDHVASLHST